MSDEKTRVKITVHLNSQYEGRSYLMSPYVREFLQELCDMGAEQHFSPQTLSGLVVIYIDVSLSGGPIIVSTETTTFGTINGSDHVPIPTLANNMIVSMIRSIGDLVENDIRDTLEELKKPETVYVPTGVTYRGYPVVLQVTGRGDSLTSDVAVAKDVARRVLHSVHTFADNHSWTFAGGSASEHRLSRYSLHSVECMTALYDTGLCCEGFSVYLRATENNMYADQVAQQLRTAFRDQRDDQQRWGLISD